MEIENTLKTKSYNFALKVVKLCLEIQKERKEFVISKQFLRSATSIGANAEEAIGGFSDKDFVHKLSIAYKEARESKYWIRLLIDASIIKETIGKELLDNVEEILRMLGASISTMKKRMNA